MSTMAISSTNQICPVNEINVKKSNSKFAHKVNWFINGTIRVYREGEKIWEATKIKIHTNFVLQETKPVFGRWFSTWPHPLCHHHMHTQGPISECLGWRAVPVFRVLKGKLFGISSMLIWKGVGKPITFIHSFRSNNEVNRWKYWHYRTSNKAQTI